ncbi:MAG: radical SAM protein [bacterium]|nr:radical SAM protein [bacterium]
MTVTLSTSSHPRAFADNCYVYAVLSRRARGVSIGLNLNPDKICNFSCAYCQVERREPQIAAAIQPEVLRRELRDMLEKISAGFFDEVVRERGLDASMGRVTEVGIAGDAEPTSSPAFCELMIITREEIEASGLDLPLVLYTNASLLQREKVQRGIAELDRLHGVVYAKLDAGTESYFQRVAQTKVPFARILENLALRARSATGRTQIQSLFSCISGDPPPPEEIQAYGARLASIVDGGGRLESIQLMTVARPPAEAKMTPLTREQLESIAAEVRRQVPGVPVEVF